MTDVFTKEKRSEVMGRIRSKDTKPEKIVRSYIYSKGIRYRLYKNNLPGKPDIVISRIKTLVFVNGCFWHHHKNCKRANIPKTNTHYWNKKIETNIKRDKSNITELEKLGWNVIILWECDVKQIEDNKQIDDLIHKYHKSFENNFLIS